MSYTSTLVLLLHLIYLSYVYRACSFFTNLDLFSIDNARVIYRKIRYFFSIAKKKWLRERATLRYTHIILLKVASTSTVSTLVLWSFYMWKAGRCWRCGAARPCKQTQLVNEQDVSTYVIKLWMKWGSRAVFHSIRRIFFPVGLVPLSFDFSWSITGVVCMGNWSKLCIHHAISTTVHVKSLNKSLNLLLWPTNWTLSIYIATAFWTGPWQDHEHEWCNGLQCGCIHVRRVQVKCDGTRWRTGREVKGKLANGVGSQYSSHYLGT